MTELATKLAEERRLTLAEAAQAISEAASTRAMRDDWKQAWKGEVTRAESAEADVVALEARVQKLRDALFSVTWTVINESEGHTFGKRGYDITLDHLHDVAVSAREVLYDD